MSVRFGTTPGSFSVPYAYVRNTYPNQITWLNPVGFPLGRLIDLGAHCGGGAPPLGNYSSCLAGLMVHDSARNLILDSGHVTFPYGRAWRVRSANFFLGGPNPTSGYLTQWHTYTGAFQWSVNHDANHWAGNGVNPGPGSLNAGTGFRGAVANGYPSWGDGSIGMYGDVNPLHVYARRSSLWHQIYLKLHRTGSWNYPTKVTVRRGGAWGTPVQMNEVAQEDLLFKRNGVLVPLTELDQNDYFLTQSTPGKDASIYIRHWTHGQPILEAGIARFEPGLKVRFGSKEEGYKSYRQSKGILVPA